MKLSKDYLKRLIKLGKGRAEGIVIDNGEEWMIVTQMYTAY